MSMSVMVVDDEPMARTLLRLMLSRANFEVVEAADGFEALEKTAHHAPDVMILDVMMPFINGFEVCKKLRHQAQTAGMPIIMLSARTDREGYDQGMTSGATRYLQKPVTHHELIKHIQEVLA